MAEDFENEDEVITITSAPEDFIELRSALTSAGYSNFITDEITKTSESQVSPDLDIVKRNIALIELLEGHDDIESVYHNLDIRDDVASLL